MVLSSIGPNRERGLMGGNGGILVDPEEPRGRDGGTSSAEEVATEMALTELTPPGEVERSFRTAPEHLYRDLVEHLGAGMWAFPIRRLVEF